MNTLKSSSFLTHDELLGIGFGKIGSNVKVSRHAIFYMPEKIFLSSNCRIDDSVIISAGSKVTIGKHVHLSLGVCILGKGEVVIGDYSAISVKTSIFSSNDDYSGESMTNPTVPNHLRNVTVGKVHIGKHVIVGAHSVILPDSHLGPVSAYGAFSLIKGTYEKNTMYAGIPAKKIGSRSDNCVKLAKNI